MAKPKVTFKFERIREGEWQIMAECAGVETKYITGLKTKDEVDHWLGGDRRQNWLKENGYAKRSG